MYGETSFCRRTGYIRGHELRRRILKMVTSDDKCHKAQAPRRAVPILLYPVKFQLQRTIAIEGNKKEVGQFSIFFFVCLARRQEMCRSKHKREVQFCFLPTQGNKAPQERRRGKGGNRWGDGKLLGSAAGISDLSTATLSLVYKRTQQNTSFLGLYTPRSQRLTHFAILLKHTVTNIVPNAGFELSMLQNGCCMKRLMERGLSRIANILGDPAPLVFFNMLYF